MASGSSFRFGILLVKGSLRPLQLHIIVEPWLFCWCMMLQMSLHLTAMPTDKGQALADEYKIKFFETSAKTNLNVEEVLFSIARDIKQELADSDLKQELNRQFQSSQQTNQAIKQLLNHPAVIRTGATLWIGQSHCVSGWCRSRNV